LIAGDTTGAEEALAHVHVAAGDSEGPVGPEWLSDARYLHRFKVRRYE
jgi:hypothetical protein